ncbi:hypothetical protein [Nostoc sp. CALU 546]|uniref:hypothetical protein n=1 Tax=Nostoc sp. CALU 546 TaxID=1867241 RepID=UPI003B670BE3
MKILSSSFLFSTLSLITAVIPAQAVNAPPKELAIFCSTTRNEYVENVRKRYESQDYKGKGGAGAGISSQGINFGGNGSYEWKRTWDNFDSNKKQEYSNKNCDEVLKQWGAVSIAEIHADAEKAIEKMKLEGNKYREDTIRIVEGFKLEAININATTRFRIEELQQAGRIEEAKILSEALQRKIEVQEKGMTDRVRIETDALIAMNKADNAVELKKAELNAAVANRQSLNQLIGTGIESLVAYFGSRSEVEKEKIRADVKIKEIEAQIKIEEIKSKNNIDPNLALIQSWELTPTSCASGGQIVTIMIDNKQYCVNSHYDLTARSYQYNRATNQLEVLSSQIITSPNPNPTPYIGPGL